MKDESEFPYALRCIIRNPEGGVASIHIDNLRSPDAFSPPSRTPLDEEWCSLYDCDTGAVSHVRGRDIIRYYIAPPGGPRHD